MENPSDSGLISNLGLTLLREIITQVSGVPYEQYIQENILSPLGLEGTRPYLPKDLHLRIYGPIISQNIFSGWQK